MYLFTFWVHVNFLSYKTGKGMWQEECPVVKKMGKVDVKSNEEISIVTVGAGVAVW